eukprot:TRINITY_DN434_c0_g1_i1.p1 TRINITY_DN434_c0_g1~~TRINITY_DN434_c0_g1_i1.p1  ORF type:complete len:705 (-),score=77.02 TRINITY_DN434_c0_g1_i1:88-2139(-)
MCIRDRCCVEAVTTLASLAKKHPCGFNTRSHMSFSSLSNDGMLSEAELESKIAVMRSELKPVLSDAITLNHIREAGAIYVDKTPELSKIIMDSGRYFFCARPRRMGKSLNLKVLQAIYEKKIALLKGTWISEAHCPILEKEGPYPVIFLSAPSFDQNSNGKSTSLLERGLNMVLKDEAIRHGLQIPTDDKGVIDFNSSPSLNFRNLIHTLGREKGYPSITGEKEIVVLIDEYDRPIFDLVKRLPDKGVVPDLEIVQSMLHNFYLQLKECGIYIKKCLIVGGAKFAKLSVFSALNLLQDISESDKYASLFGITKAEALSNPEIVKYFEFIKLRIQKETKKITTVDQILETLLQYYDGYQFSENQNIKVLSPFAFVSYLKNTATSSRNLIANGELRMVNYWFKSGTPTSFMYAAAQYPLTIFHSLDTKGANRIKSSLLEESCMPILYHKNPYLQLYQSGYLTMDSYDPIRKEYILRYPNKEVRASLEDSVLPYRDEMYKADIVDMMRERNWKNVYLEMKRWLTEKKEQIYDNEAFYQDIILAMLHHNRKENDIVESQPNLSGGRPDGIFGSYIDKENCLMINIELKHINAGKKHLKENAQFRRYVEKTKESKTIGEWMDNKKAHFYTMDLVFGHLQLQCMRVHEYDEVGAHKCVFLEGTKWLLGVYENPSVHPQKDKLEQFTTLN